MGLESLRESLHELHPSYKRIFYLHIDAFTTPPEQIAEEAQTLLLMRGNALIINARNLDKAGVHTQDGLIAVNENRINNTGAKSSVNQLLGHSHMIQINDALFKKDIIGAQYLMDPQFLLDSETPYASLFRLLSLNAVPVLSPNGLTVALEKQKIFLDTELPDLLDTRARDLYGIPVIQIL